MTEEEQALRTYGKAHLAYHKVWATILGMDLEDYLRENVSLDAVLHEHDATLTGVLDRIGEITGIRDRLSQALIYRDIGIDLERYDNNEGGVILKGKDTALFIAESLGIETFGRTETTLRTVRELFGL